MWPDSGKHVRAQEQPNPENKYICFLIPTHWKQITISPPLSHHLHTLDRSLWSPPWECFFLFPYMSGEIDGALALTEGLPATPLTTQVICAWFLHQSRAATAHDGWPVMTRDGRRNHVIYNRVSQSTNEHATFRTAWNTSTRAQTDTGFIQILAAANKINVEQNTHKPRSYPAAYKKLFSEATRNRKAVMLTELHCGAALKGLCVDMRVEMWENHSKL